MNQSFPCACCEERQFGEEEVKRAFWQGRCETGILVVKTQKWQFFGGKEVVSWEGGSFPGKEVVLLGRRSVATMNQVWHQ